MGALDQTSLATSLQPGFGSCCRCGGRKCAGGGAVGKATGSLIPLWAPSRNHTHTLHVWYTYLHNWVMYGVNVGKYYTIHGAYGIGKCSFNQETIGNFIRFIAELNADTWQCLFRTIATMFCGQNNCSICSLVYKLTNITGGPHLAVWLKHP